MADDVGAVAADDHDVHEIQAVVAEVRFRHVQVKDDVGDRPLGRFGSRGHLALQRHGHLRPCLRFAAVEPQAALPHLLFEINLSVKADKQVESGAASRRLLEIAHIHGESLVRAHGRDAHFAPGALVPHLVSDQRSYLSAPTGRTFHERAGQIVQQHAAEDVGELFRRRRPWIGASLADRREQQQSHDEPAIVHASLPALSRLCGRGVGGEGVGRVKCRTPSPLAPLPQSQERGTRGIAQIILSPVSPRRRVCTM